MLVIPIAVMSGTKTEVIHTLGKAWIKPALKKRLCPRQTVLCFVFLWVTRSDLKLRKGKASVFLWDQPVQQTYAMSEHQLPVKQEWSDGT